MPIPERGPCLAVFGACALPRLAWLPLAPQPFRSNYVAIADARTFPTSLEPLYPLFLTATGPSDTTRLLAQIAFVSIGGICLFLLTLRLTESRRGAAAAAAWYALNPYLLWQSTAFNGAPFGAALLAAALWLFDRIQGPRDAAPAGAAFGLLVLTRFSYAPLVACGAFVLAWRRRWADTVTLCAVAAAIVSLWMVRTYMADGGLLPSRSGINLYLSTCEYRTLIPAYDLDVLIPPTYARLEPATAGLPPERGHRVRDNLLVTEALDCAADGPLGTAAFKLKQAALTFSPWLMPYHPRGPDSEAVQVGGRLELRRMPDREPLAAWTHALSMSALIAMALVGIASGRVKRPSMMFLALACFALTNGVFMQSTRLASPAYVPLMVFAGGALARRP